MKKTLVALFLFAAFYLNAQNDRKIEPMYPGIYKVSMGKIDPFTPFSLCESQPKTKELNASTSSNEYVRPEQISIEINERGCLVEIPLKGDEQLYGFGLQIGSFMQKGLRKKPIVNDNPLNDLGYSHAPQTFYVSNKGYGIIINTSRYTTFYGGNLQLKNKAEKTAKQSVQKIATTTDDLYSTQSSGSNMQVDIPGASGIEVFLICGDNLKDVIEKYNLMSGGGALPPMWGLGVKYRMKGDSNADAVTKMAAYFRDKKIPCDVLGLEPGWQTAAYSCSYVWEKKRFPDPEGLIKDLGKQSFHVNLWEHAFVNSSSPIHDSLMNYSGNYQVWNGLVPDFLTKEGRAIFKEYHKKTLADIGVSGFKLDECDNSNLAYGSGAWSFPDHAKFPSGIDGEQMHQLFGSMYLRTMNSIYKDMNQRTYSDYRSG
ncbi:MAG TPA: TIM-barrel domain-containing protein, partial [Bacteroidales bacterium]